MAGQLYGRKFEIDLVNELMLRKVDKEGRVDDWHRPVLVIEAATASGKTVLLDELSRRCAGTVPNAYVDLAAIEPVLEENPIPQLLAAIAFELSGRCRLYGSLKFDRLVIGLLAMRLMLNPLDDPDSRRQVEDLLRQRRGLPALQRSLGQIANQALALSPTPYTPSADLVTSAMTWIVDRLSSWSPMRRRMLGRFQDWYGHQDRDEGLDPVTVLAGMNGTNHHRPDPGHRRVNDLLWRAFLADMRDNFHRGKHAEDWTLNALVVLDNADTQLGVDFLHRVVQPNLTDDDAPAPLTIVASSRGGLLGTLTRGDRATVRDVIRVREAQPENPHVTWLRRELSPFTVDDVRVLLEKLGPPGGQHRIAAIVLHQLAGGHPGGTYALLEAIALKGNALVEPSDLLESEYSGGTLEDVLHRRLFVGISDDALDLITICSAARNHAEGVAIAGHFGGRYRTELPILITGLWDRHSANRTTLHRLLLLRRLAGREDSPDSWHAVHERLRESAARHRDDLASELYHTLALGKIDAVVDVLNDRLLRDPLSSWLDLVDAVTAAPRKPGDPPPVLDIQRGYVHCLVVGLWRAADPVCGLDRSTLYWRIAQAFRELTEHVGDECGDADVLLRIVDVIKHYEQLAQQWQRMIRRD